MQVRYKVMIYDTTGTKVCEIDDFRGLVIQHKVNSNGYCNIILDGNNSKIPCFGGRDYIVEIYRSVQDEGIDWYIEFEGLYRTGVKQTYVNGTKTFAAYSIGYLDLLRRRIIAYYANTAYSEKSGSIETCMKEFVNENAGPGATDPPRLMNGVVSGLTVEGDLGRGSTWAGAKAYRGLLDVLQEMSNDAGDMFFDIIGITPGTFIFRTYPDVRGTDRRLYNVDGITGLNEAGNAPVVFSVSMGNVASAALSENTSDEVNVVFGLGQGEESSRMIEIATDPASIALSPWNQSEVSRNATSEVLPEGVLSVATSVLKTLGAVTTFSFEALQIHSTVYGRDFTWGDYITAKYDDYSSHKYITGVIITVDEQNLETIRLELGDVPK